MGLFDIVREAIKTPVKLVQSAQTVAKTVVNTVASHVERATGVDIPGVGLTKEEIKASRKRKTTSPTPTRTVAKTVSKVASTVDRTVERATGVSISKAVNKAIEGVERATGVDIPGVGTTLSEEEKKQAPVQQYLNKALNPSDYGVGATATVVPKVAEVTHYNPQNPQPSLSTLVGAFGTTVGGGLAFIPDTIVEVAKGVYHVGKSVVDVAKGQPQQAVQDVVKAGYHVTRPVTMATAGVVGLVGQVGKTAKEVFDVAKAQKEVEMAMILNPSYVPEKLKNLQKEVKEATPYVLQTAGTVAGVYVLGKTYKSIETHASNIKTRIETKLSKNYIKPKEIRVVYNPKEVGKTGRVYDLGQDIGQVYITEDATIPRSLSYLKSLEGKQVKGIHMSISPALAKNLKQGRFITKGFPEMAKGFRKEWDMLHFYISAPEKDKAVAYGFYAGIGKGESQTVWSPKSLITFKRTNPQMVIVEGKVQTPSVLYSLGKKYRATKSPTILKKMATIQGKEAGKIQVPVENIAQAGPYYYEGQLIIPSQFKGRFGEYPGTVMKSEYVGWTTYKPVRPSTGSSFLDLLREIVFPTKIHKIDIWKAKPGGPATSVSGMSSIPVLEITPDYYSPRTPATIFDVGREASRVASGGVPGLITMTERPRIREKPQPEYKPPEMAMPEYKPPEPMPEEPTPEMPEEVAPPEEITPPPERPPRHPEGRPRRPEFRPPEPKPELPRMEPRRSRPEPRRRPWVEKAPRYLEPRPEPPMRFQDIFPRRRYFSIPKGKTTIHGMWKAFRGKDTKKSLLADLLSVTESHAWFGRATHPKPTKEIWKLGRKTLFMRIPTKELMKLGGKKKNVFGLFGAKKKKKRKSRKEVLL